MTVPSPLSSPLSSPLHRSSHLPAQKTVRSLSHDPQVHVIIATYNDALRLETAITSALAQMEETGEIGETGRALSVIVADDASEDDTAARVAAIAAQNAAQNAAVSLVQAPVNLGPGGVRNLALERTICAKAAAPPGPQTEHHETSWVAVLDSDDTFEAGRLARMLHHAEAQGADIVIDDFISVDGAGTALPGPRLADLHPPGILELADWLRLNDMARGTLSFGYAKPLISCQFLKQQGLRYNESLRNGEDFHLILEALAAGGRLYFSGEVGYRYTRRAGSVSRRAKRAHMQALMAADKAFAMRLSPEQWAATAGPRAIRLRNLQSLITTEEVMGALKARKPGRALRGLASDPVAFRRLYGHLREAIGKRIGARGRA